MIKYFLIASLLISGALFPEEASMDRASHSLSSGLQGLVLVESEVDLLDAAALKEIQGLEVVSVKIPGSFQALKRDLDPVYLGRYPDLEVVQAIKKAIYAFYEEHDDPFIVITVPEQRMSSVGPVLQLIITHARLGQVSVEGNNWFVVACIKQCFSLETGETLQPNDIEADISFMNRNPFRQVSSVFSPGEEAGTTDVTLLVQERFPVRVYVGGDNTGIPTIKRQRLFEGFNWGNVWGLDHILNFQHTSSYDFKTFQAWTGQYIALLPWKHVLNVYGGVSSVKYEMPSSAGIGMNNKGTGGQASIRYLVPFRFSFDRCAEQEATIGFDYKNTNNTVLFSDVFANFAQYVNLSQFVFGYRRVQSFPSWQSALEGSLDLFWSPGPLLPDQSNADYESLRPGAKNHWIYGRASLKYGQELPRQFGFNVWLKGQLASQNLLPSEQIGIGGYDTVRGYNERQFNSDNAVLFTAEMHAPPLSFFSHCWKNLDDKLTFLVFTDYGLGWSHIPLPGEPKTDYLWSVGPGLRYVIGPYLTARLDWGIKLHRQELFSGGNTMLHFSVIVGY